MRKKETSEVKNKLILEKTKPEAKRKNVPTKIKKPTPKIEIVLVEDTENQEEDTEKPEVRIVKEEKSENQEVKIVQEEKKEEEIKEMKELREKLLEKVDLVKNEYSALQILVTHLKDLSAVDCDG